MVIIITIIIIPGTTFKAFTKVMIIYRNLQRSEYRTISQLCIGRSYE